MEPALSEYDAARVMEAALKVWPPGPDFIGRALSSVREIVGADVATFNRVSLDSGERSVTVDPPEWRARLAELEGVAHQFAFQHPLVQHFISTGEGLRAVRLSEHVTAESWHASDLYRQYYAKLGLKWQMLLTIPSADDLINVIALNRVDADFTEKDAKIAEAFLPIVALGCGGASGDADDLSLETSAGWHLLNTRITHSGERVVLEVTPPDHSGAIVAGTRLPGPPRRKSTGSAIGSPTRWLLGGDTWFVRYLGKDDGREVYAARRSDNDTGAIVGLSPRQQQVLQLVAYGHTNQEIAAELGVAEGTVRKHVENILAVTGAPNRAAAAARWRQSND